jgi:hypothetical protein
MRAIWPCRQPLGVIEVHDLDPALVAARNAVIL